MLKVYSVCTECAEVIEDPLCASCFETGVMMWLQQQDLNSSDKKVISDEFSKLVDDAKLMSFSDLRCVLCQGKMQNICVYCLIKGASEVFHNFSSSEGKILNYTANDFGIFDSINNYGVIYEIEGKFK